MYRNSFDRTTMSEISSFQTTIPDSRKNLTNCKVVIFFFFITHNIRSVVSNERYLTGNVIKVKLNCTVKNLRTIHKLLLYALRTHIIIMLQCKWYNNSRA